jgi:hypothetical protein
MLRATGCLWAFIAFTGVVDAADFERRPLAYDLGASSASYMKQYRIDVGDVRKHVLRLYDLKRTFPRNPPAFDGVRAIECLERGVSDLVDDSGTESGYVIFVLEDGNRIIGRYSGSASSRRWPDGSRHYDVRGTIELTGGTGRFERIRGAVQVWQALDPGADSSQGGAQGSYWFER